MCTSQKIPTTNVFNIQRVIYVAKSIDEKWTLSNTNVMNTNLLRQETGLIFSILIFDNFKNIQFIFFDKLLTFGETPDEQKF